MNCPKCGSQNIAEILYGYPVPPSDEKKRIEWEKTVVLGGCCIEPGLPKYCCRDCNHHFGEIDMSKYDFDEDEN